MEGGAVRKRTLKGAFGSLEIFSDFTLPEAQPTCATLQTMGIESNYVLPVKEHLTILNCSLCSNLVSLDGYVTIPCGHCFCRDCFNLWRSKLHPKSTICDCPNCGVSILPSKNSNVENLMIKPLIVAQPLVHRMLSKVKVLCPCRSHSHFCSWTGDYSGLEHHVAMFHAKPTANQAIIASSQTMKAVSEHQRSTAQYGSGSRPQSERSGNLCKSEHVRTTSAYRARGVVMERTEEPLTTSVPRRRSISMSSSNAIDRGRHPSANDVFDTNKMTESRSRRSPTRDKSTAVPLTNKNRVVDITSSFYITQQEREELAHLVSTESLGRRTPTRSTSKVDKEEQICKMSKDPSTISFESRGSSPRQECKTSSRKTLNDPVVGHNEGPSASEGNSRFDSKAIERTEIQKSDKRPVSPSRRRLDDTKPASKSLSPFDRHRSASKKTVSLSPPSRARDETIDIRFIREQANDAFKDRRYEVAHDLYTKAIDLYISCESCDPDLIASLYTNRSVTGLRQGLLQSSLNDCDAALSLNEVMPRAYSCKARLLKEMGRWEDACTCISKGLEKNPCSEDLKTELASYQNLLRRFELVQSLLENKKYKEAKTLLSKSKYTSRPAIILECKADLGLGDADEVIQKLTSKILSVDATDSKVLELVAEAHFQNGNLNEAVQVTQSACFHSPENKATSGNLKAYQEIQMCIMSGQSSMAEKQYYKAVNAFSSAIQQCNDRLPNNSALRQSLFLSRAEASLLAQSYHACLDDTNIVLSHDDTCILAWVSRIKAYQGLREHDLIVKELGSVIGSLKNQFLKDAYENALNPPAFVDLYELYGVSRDASVDEIKMQYSLKSRQLHPANFIGHEFTEVQRREADENLTLLEQGFSILCDPFQRRLYDAGHDLDSIRNQADAVTQPTAFQCQSAKSA